MKPEKQLEVQAWLKKAKNDLRGAHINLEASPPLIEDATMAWYKYPQP